MALFGWILVAFVGLNMLYEVKCMMGFDLLPGHYGEFFPMKTWVRGLLQDDPPAKSVAANSDAPEVAPWLEGKRYGAVSRREKFVAKPAAARVLTRSNSLSRVEMRD
jgi:hypothetical protein